MTCHSAEGSNFKNEYSRISLGLEFGTLTPYGDIKEYRYIPASGEWGRGGGFLLNYHFTSIFTLQGHFAMGELTGTRQQNNHRFESDLLEGNLKSRISLSRLLAPTNTMNEWVNIYGVFGVGVVGFRTKKMTYDTREIINTVGFSLDGAIKENRQAELILPFGLGVNFKVSERVDVGLSSAFRYANTDHLDGRATAGGAKDMYNYTSVGLTFRVASNTRSMDWASVQETLYPGDVARMNHLSTRVDELKSEVTTLEEEKKSSKAELEKVKKTVEVIKTEKDHLAREVFLLKDTVQVISKRTLAPPPEVKKEEPVKAGEFFAVQVMATRRNTPEEEVRQYLGLSMQPMRHFSGRLYRYTIGQFTSAGEAAARMQKLRANGVHDAFVVKIINGSLVDN